MQNALSSLLNLAFLICVILVSLLRTSFWKKKNIYSIKIGLFLTVKNGAAENKMQNNWVK